VAFLQRPIVAEVMKSSSEKSENKSLRATFCLMDDGLARGIPLFLGFFACSGGK